MPENPNPYLDPSMDPNGYVPNNGQMGFVDETDPYMQQGNWNQDQFGAVPGQPGFPDGTQGNGYLGDYMSPGNMMSAQDIYANQAAQMNDPLAPMSGSPDFGGMGADAGMFGSPGYGEMGFDPMGFPDQGFGAPGSFQDPGLSGPQYGAPGYGNPYQFDEFGQPLSGGGQPAPGAVPNIYEQPSQPSGAQNIPAAPAAPSGAAVPGQTAAGVEGQQSGPASQPSQPGADAAAVQAKQGAQAAAQGQSDGQQGAPNRPPQAQGQRRGAPRRPMGMPINRALARPGRAKLALVLAILSIIFSLVAPIGFILALFAMKISGSYKRNGGRSGAGDAARIFSVVGLVFSSLMLALIVWFFGYYLGYAQWSFMYMTPITYFNNSPLGMIFSLPVPNP